MMGQYQICPANPYVSPDYNKVYTKCPANQHDGPKITRRQARYILRNTASNAQTSQICDDKDKKMTTNNKNLAKQTVTFNTNPTIHTVNRYIKKMQCYTSLTGQI
jgi:hypothetical protein